MGVCTDLDLIRKALAAAQMMTKIPQDFHSMEMGALQPSVECDPIIC